MKYFLLLALFVSGVTNAYTQTEDETISSLERAITQTNNNEQKISLLHQLSSHLLWVDPSLALNRAEQALDLAQASDQIQLQIKSHLAIGQVYLTLKQYDKAKQAFDRALASDQIDQYPPLEIDANNGLSRLYLQKSKNVEAYRLIVQNLKKAENTGYTLGQAEAYVLLGTWFTEQNKKQGLKDALKRYDQALSLYRSESALTATSEVLYQIGSLYHHFQADYNKALLYYYEALETAETVNVKPLIAKYLNTIGTLFLEDKEEYEPALKYFLRSYGVCKNYNFYQNGQKLAEAIQGVMGCYVNMAKYYAEHNNRFKADEYDSRYHTFQNLLTKLKTRQYQVNALLDNNTNSQNSEGQRVYTMSAPDLESDPGSETEAPALDLDSDMAEDRAKVIEELKNEVSPEDDSLSYSILDKNQASLDIKTKNEPPKTNSKSTPFGWGLLGLSLILIALLGYFVYTHQQSQRKFQEHKSKLEAINERANRQEIVLREKEDAINKKEVELADAYAQIDDAKMESSSLTQILSEEVAPPLKKIIAESSQEKTNPHLLKQLAGYTLNILNGIITVQAINKDELMLDKSQHSIFKVARKAVDQFSELIAQKGLTVDNHIKPFYYAEFDADIIEKVFLCLLENSLKYTAPGGKVSLDAWQLEKHHTQFIRVSIGDNGQSIPESSIASVFKKFAPEEARPSGMGLAYVKMAVEAHGGSVEVISVPQEGTSFVFTLPEAKPQIIKEQADLASENLSPTELQILEPYLGEFRGLEFYETSALKSLLSRMDCQENAKVLQWKQEMEDAIYSLDEGKFKQLIARG